MLNISNICLKIDNISLMLFGPYYNTKYMSYKCEIDAVDMDVFSRIINISKWEDNTIYVKKDKENVKNSNKIISRVSYIPESMVHELKLLSALGNRLQVKDERFISSKIIMHNTKIIHYPKNGFMMMHADMQPKMNFVGRLIFIPPAEDKYPMFKFDGGKMRTLGMEGTCVYYQQENKWTVVFIPYGLAHEIQPVLSGDRYVIVTDITVDGIAYTINQANYDSSEECDVGPEHDYDW